MINRRAFIYLIITLLIGFALGLFSGGLYQLRKDDRRNPMVPPFAIRFMLTRDLQLTDTQIDQVSEIFRKYEKKAVQRREEIRKQVSEDLQSLKQDLIPYLTEEQIQILDGWTEGRPPAGSRPIPGLIPGMFPPDQWHNLTPPGPPGQHLPPGVPPHLPGKKDLPGIQDTIPLK